jgi:hypothetical protein
MPFSQPTPTPCQWFSRLAAALDRRSAVRLALVFVRAVLARGRPSGFHIYDRGCSPPLLERLGLN